MTAAKNGRSLLYVRERMKILNFINDKKLVSDWLDAQGRSLEVEGLFFSYWLHEDGLGFGLVITAEKSGEFHLMHNGDVTSHVEQYNRETQGFDVLNSDWRPTAHFHEFEQLYNSFRERVIS